MGKAPKPDSETESGRSRTFTGRSYSRRPRRSVMWIDDLARRLITLSGIGGILAVTLVGLFLVWVALPLLMPAKIEKSRDLPPVVAVADRDFVASGIDNYGIMTWGVTAAGEVIVRALADGAEVARSHVGEGVPPTAWAFGVGTGQTAFGYADGQSQIVAMSWQTDFLAEDEAPAELGSMAIGESRVWEGGVLVRTPEDQLRHQRLEIEAQESVKLGSAPIVLIDLANTPSGLVLAAVDADSVFHQRTLTMKTNMLTGKVSVRARGGDLDLASLDLGPGAAFQSLHLNDTGDLALLIRRDGTTLRLLRQGEDFGLDGSQDLLPDPEVEITVTTFLGGRTSLVVGDSKGRVTIWFPARGTADNSLTMVAAHELNPGTAAVTALATSGRSRQLAVGYADGQLQLFNATNERVLGHDRLDGQSIVNLTIAPREDLVLVGGSRQEGLWAVDAEYGEVSFAALVRPIWYEGYPGPAYVWQSSAGSDSFEPKLSLIPLIFGTLKATFYSLLFGLPLALLAAIFTSEFLSKGSRAKVKPVIEIMASLPSVVLGFLAALVVAPWVEQVVVEVLTVLITVPFFVLLGAHFWQMLPRDLAAKLDSWRSVAVFVALALGSMIAWNLAPTVEDLLFSGDFKAWLDGRVGSGVGGWFVLLLMPSAAVVAWVNLRHGDGFMRSRGRGWTSLSLAGLDLLRFLIATSLAVTTALFAAWLLNASGWDLRGTLFDTYVQRNALVVGIAMGFAIIPLIYTISEDALVAVPDHLRAASLGAGATTWQTAIRVVVPPAMSGLFSAGMIGLGRAVGETMIVLMAAGNTPIMEMNIFNGFRTLSANLAVELPEAVQGSTHYRTLFLAALTLFAMTFILNTVAEAVRLRFRGKTSRL